LAKAGADLEANDVGVDALWITVLIL
jgi:hypothetical protein